MNVYIKAAFDTIAFLVYIAVVYLGVTYLLETYGEKGSYVLAAALGGVCLYLVYSVSLARRKYKETVKSINTRKEA